VTVHMFIRQSSRR